jgi:mannose/fructose-specific phosphotransferase system component IIA
LSVGVVILTHGVTGSHILADAEFVLSEKMEGVELVTYNQAEDQAAAMVAIHAAIEKADQGDGVLLLTDLFGASPSNRAALILEHFEAVMVSGINLAMLVCVWNYRDRPLGMLARKAAECGNRGIRITQK